MAFCVESVKLVFGQAGFAVDNVFPGAGVPAHGAGGFQVKVLPTTGAITVPFIVILSVLATPAVELFQSVVVVRLLKSAAVFPPRPTSAVLPVALKTTVPYITCMVFAVSLSLIWKFKLSPVLLYFLYP